MEVRIYSQNCAPSVETWGIAKSLVTALKQTLSRVEVEVGEQVQLRVYHEPVRDGQCAVRASAGFASEAFLEPVHVEAIRKDLYAVEGVVISLHPRFTAFGARFHFVEFFALLPAKGKRAKARKGDGESE